MDMHVVVRIVIQLSRQTMSVCYEAKVDWGRWHPDGVVETPALLSIQNLD